MGVDQSTSPRPGVTNDAHFGAAIQRGSGFRDAGVAGGGGGVAGPRSPVPISPLWFPREELLAGLPPANEMEYLERLYRNTTLSDCGI